jgi:hypothetical protein
VHDRSILIDLGGFKALEVDETNRTARVSPSITSKELNDVLIEKHGLMFHGGHCPDVGLGGFLLQGGMGWNCRVGLLLISFSYLPPFRYILFHIFLSATIYLLLTIIHVLRTGAGPVKAWTLWK